MYGRTWSGSIFILSPAPPWSTKTGWQQRGSSPVRCYQPVMCFLRPAVKPLAEGQAKALVWTSGILAPVASFGGSL